MNSWSDVVKANIARSEERFKQTNIFSMEYIQCLQKLLPSFQTYFDSVKPEPFFDDATTKNVLIKDAAFSGIIDIESICFGDRLFFVALTQMALHSMKADLDYV